ncbi:DUF1564 family protein [Leptospira ilyithenensis]|uniref:DUF1564 family protein n=1 Tax=Leptospira ilyithenensis TaxID=2484901 RepID=A0A4R9LPB3_9LEPT|nr:DUF1564 family protein [Leptospira ilyithenensis]TGN10925.1 DUF1564 family protein [Leptospira ilyithenensis]
MKNFIKNPMYSSRFVSARNRSSFRSLEKIGVMFLVPCELMPHLSILRKFGGISRALSVLLSRYSEMVSKGIGRGAKGGSVILYQEEGLELQRLGARVRERDWVELSLLAEFLGVSRCCLFAKLLELDLLGWGAKLGEAGFVRPIASLPFLSLKSQLLPYPIQHKYKTKMTYLL